MQIENPVLAIKEHLRAVRLRPFQAAIEKSACMQCRRNVGLTRKARSFQPTTGYRILRPWLRLSGSARANRSAVHYVLRHGDAGRSWSWRGESDSGV